MERTIRIVSGSPDRFKSDKGRESLALDVEALRARLGPKKVALIDQWVREINGPYDMAIGAFVNPKSVVLDAGCSRGDPDLPSLQKGKYLVGCDVDMFVLGDNSIAQGKVLAPMGTFPFADASFDVVVCKWVVEHLECPDLDFAECFRVLKPGGVVALLTPNARSIFALVSRLIPFHAKARAKHWIFGLEEEDTFRTWYRANTRLRLDRLMSEAGFERWGFAYLPGMWTFFIFNGALARTVRWLERFQMRLPVLRGATSFILGVWRKPEED